MFVCECIYVYICLYMTLCIRVHVYITFGWSFLLIIQFTETRHKIVVILLDQIAHIARELFIL